MTQRVVIIGAGAAGTSAAMQLRRLGYRGPLTLVHAEAAAPYNRTSVNKTLLQPDAQLESVRLAIPSDPHTQLLPARAEHLDTERHGVVLGDGTLVPYDAVLIATGAHPRSLAARAGVARASDLGARVTPLRTYADAVGVREAMATAQRERGRAARVAIVGAGLLGAEAADSLSAQGHEVFLVDESAAPLRRRLGATIGSWVEAQHHDRLAARLVAGVEALEVAQDRSVIASLSDGSQLGVDLVIEALGVIPDVGWLETSSLVLDDGVQVTDRLTAVNVDGVYAAGDLARVHGTTRIEHWGHASAHGSHAARSIACGLGLAEDPGPFQPSGSYSTWLYGRPINVIGGRRKDDREISAAPPGSAAQVTLYADAKNCLSAAVTLGSAKVANRLRPLVTVGAPIDAAAELVARVLTPSAPGV